MSYVNTTLIRVPTDVMPSGYHKGRAFEILVCIYDPLGDADEEWVKLDTILQSPTRYRIDHVKTVGIVLACARAGIAWNATIVVNGHAHVANYWMVAGLVAGSTMGVKFSGRKGCKEIETAKVCVVHSTANEVLLYGDTNIANETNDDWNLCLKIATYYGKTSPFVLDGITPIPGHEPLFRDPIQVVVCQHSPHTFFKEIADDDSEDDDSESDNDINSIDEPSSPGSSSSASSPNSTDYPGPPRGGEDPEDPPKIDMIGSKNPISFPLPLSDAARKFILDKKNRDVGRSSAALLDAIKQKRKSNRLGSSDKTFASLIKSDSLDLTMPLQRYDAVVGLAPGRYDAHVASP